jgi:hypothetical protein
MLGLAHIDINLTPIIIGAVMKQFVLLLSFGFIFGLQAKEMELVRNVRVELQQGMMKDPSVKVGGYFVTRAFGQFTFVRTENTPRVARVHMNYDFLGNCYTRDVDAAYADACYYGKKVPVNTFTSITFKWKEKLPAGVTETYEIDIVQEDEMAKGLDIIMIDGDNAIRPKHRKFLGNYLFKF